MSALVLGRLALSRFLLAAGFSHVSDDDFSRVVIAEEFAHAPRLDPSGTSWLPFPFWLNGAAMMAFGRSLATARGVAIALGAASVVAVYTAEGAARVERSVAFVATALAMLLPWNAWLGVATVPDGFTAALLSAVAITVTVPQARVAAAIAVSAAALSRYEAWPVAAAVTAVAAGAVVVHIRADTKRGPCSSRLRGDAFAAALAAFGPLSWMLWNLHAHGSATHFLDRVARYRAAIGAAPTSLGTRLLGYPRALLEQGSAPGVMMLGIAGLAAALALRRRTSIAARAEPRVLLGAAAVLVGMLAFLVYGDVKDGAPTHHPERALGAISWVTALFAVEGAWRVFDVWARGHAWRQRLCVAVAAVLLALGAREWRTALANFPGSGSDDRRAQIQRGEALRQTDAASVAVTPCAYEHFALIAAFGAPERVHVLAKDSARRAEVAEPSAECPVVHVEPTAVQRREE